MRTGKYELVVVWDSGDKEIYEYPTKEEAETAKRGFETAFGNQLWVCVREQLTNGR